MERETIEGKGRQQMGKNGRRSMEGSSAIISSVLSDLKDGYGNAYPSELYGMTRSYLGKWLVSQGGKGSRRTEDVSSLPEEYRQTVVFGGAQSYMLGYATGLDHDYFPDTVTTSDIISDMGVDPSVIEGMARYLSDVYPHHIIVRAVAHCTAIMDIGLNEGYDSDDDDEDVDNDDSVYLSIVRECFKAFCHGCSDGEAALAAGKLPYVKVNDAVCAHLIVGGCVSAVNVAFDDNKHREDELKGTPICMAAIADESDRDAEALIIPVPPDVAQKGEFSYDTASGKVTYTFDADDAPDFMNGVNVNAEIARKVTLYTLQEHGYYDGLSDDDMQQVGKLVSDDAQARAGSDVYDFANSGTIGPSGIHTILESFLPTFENFVRSYLLHPSGVYEDGYMDEAVTSAAAFASTYLHGLTEAIAGDVNEMDTELPDGIPFDTEDALRIARDRVSEWCTKNRIADWVYVAAMVNIADTYMESMDDDDDENDEDTDEIDYDDMYGYGSESDGFDDEFDDDDSPLSRVGIIAAQSKILAALGIGYACGIIASGVGDAYGEMDKDVSWV